jgi:tetratricopeptide (TPR) repeat protein
VEESRDLWRRAVAAQESLLRVEPGILGHRLQLATSLDRLGTLELRRGDRAAAEAAFEGALRNMDRVAALRPESAERLAHRVRVSYVLVTLKEADRPSECLVLLDEADRATKELSSMPGGDGLEWVRVADLSFARARVLIALGRNEAARATLEAYRPRLRDPAVPKINAAVLAASVEAQLSRIAADEDARRAHLDEAMRLVGLAVEAGLKDVRILERSMNLVPLHDDPRFRALIGRGEGAGP